MANQFVRYQILDGSTDFPRIVEECETKTEALREYQSRKNQGYDNLRLVEIDDRRDRSERTIMRENLEIA